jgi:hypothetical protein
MKCVVRLSRNVIQYDPKKTDLAYGITHLMGGSSSGYGGGGAGGSRGGSIPSACPPTFVILITSLVATEELLAKLGVGKRLSHELEGGVLTFTFEGAAIGSAVLPEAGTEANCLGKISYIAVVDNCDPASRRVRVRFLRQE